MVINDLIIRDKVFSISTFQVDNVDYLLAKNVQSKSCRKNDFSLFLQLNIIN